MSTPHDRSRVGKGVPTGGQFKNERRKPVMVANDDDTLADVVWTHSIAEWGMFGFSLESAKDWSRTQFTPLEARSWLDIGCDPDEAKRWEAEFLFPDFARPWREAEFGIKEARSWHVYNFSPQVAAEWRSLGFDAVSANRWAEKFEPEEANRWVECGFKGSDTQFVFAWKAIGVEPREAGELAFQGYTPKDHAQKIGADPGLFTYTPVRSFQDEEAEWEAAGVPGLLARQWVILRFSLSAALVWQAAGIMPVDADKIRVRLTN